MQKVEQKKNWTLSAVAFHRFLEWLDEGKNSEGQNYLLMRERLISYFDRKNCRTPDEFADETFNRVARRLEEEGAIISETPAKYCYIVARFVFLESLRGMDKSCIPLDDVLRKTRALPVLTPEAVGEEKEVKEKMLDCLDRCVSGLDTANREIIINYYYGAERIKIENRRALAQKFGVSPNALSIRACRIRDKLEACVEKCLDTT